MFAGRYKFWLVVGFIAMLFIGVVVAAVYLSDQFTRLQQTRVDHGGRTYDFWIESDETTLFACGRVTGSEGPLFRKPFARIRSDDDRYEARIRYVPEITTVHFVFRNQSHSYKLGDPAH